MTKLIEFNEVELDLLRTALMYWRCYLHHEKIKRDVPTPFEFAGEFTNRRIDEMLKKLTDPL